MHFNNYISKVLELLACQESSYPSLMHVQNKFETGSTSILKEVGYRALEQNMV